MDIKRFITKEDFLSIVPFNEGGTLIDGRRYASISTNKKMHPENQLKNLGKPDKIGEGVIDKVFFFEVVKDLAEENSITFHLVAAKIVDRYRFVSEQEVLKEVALVRAKIKNQEKREEG